MILLILLYLDFFGDEGHVARLLSVHFLAPILALHPLSVILAVGGVAVPAFTPITSNSAMASTIWPFH